MRAARARKVYARCWSSRLDSVSSLGGMALKSQRRKLRNKELWKYGRANTSVSNIRFE